MARNGLALPDEFSNFQTQKARKFVAETYSSDFTLTKRMKTLEDLFHERDSVKNEVESRLPNDENVEPLAEIPGIGRQTAVQILSMIVDINRFEDSEKFCSYFGMVPKSIIPAKP